MVMVVVAVAAASGPERGRRNCSERRELANISVDLYGPGRALAVISKRGNAEQLHFGVQSLSLSLSLSLAGSA